MANVQFYLAYYITFLFNIRKNEYKNNSLRTFVLLRGSAPEMIQYYLQFEYLFGELNEKHIGVCFIAQPFLLAQERFFYLFQQIGNTDL